jgi:peptide/nickel transport system substrate-binding protein
MHIHRAKPSTVLLLAVLAAACASPDTGTVVGEDDVAEAERYGGTVVLGAPADLQTMNALTSSDYNTRMVQQDMLLMTLIRYTEDLEPEAYLAERWDTVRVAPDTLALTFHLRRDVSWHDGPRTTAEDVRFTFERAVDPATGFPNLSAFELWSRQVETPDSFTIRFRLRAHSDFLAVWVETPIVPAHRLRDVPPERLGQDPFGTRDPVGNGPFRFVRRVPGQEWVFEANEEFPEGLGGRPFIDRVIYRVIPEQTTLLTELLTGRIDVFLNPGAAQTGQIESAAGVRLLTSPFRSYEYIAWNTRLPVFRDPRVRRALTMAIDRQALVDALLYGHGEVGVSTSTPSHWAFPLQDGLGLPYDPEGARRLLREAGWEDRSGDGILENEEGVPLRFTLVTNQGSATRSDAATIIQAQLRPLGIVVEPRMLEWNTLVTLLDGAVNARGERERGFQAVVSGWVLGFRKDDSSMLHSRYLQTPFQETGFSHPRADVLMDTLALIVDREQAAPLWVEYHRLLVEQSPYTVLFYPRRLLAIRDRVRGVEVDLRGDLQSIRRWWLR